MLRMCSLPVEVGYIPEMSVVRAGAQTGAQDQTRVAGGTVEAGPATATPEAPTLLADQAPQKRKASVRPSRLQLAILAGTVLAVAVVAIIALKGGKEATTSAPPVKAVARVVAGKPNWRGLQVGMKQGDVEQLLGSPSRVDVSPVSTRWYYGDHREGEVQFDTDSRRVKGWREPEQ